MYQEYVDPPLTVEIEFSSSDSGRRTFEEFERVVVYDGEQDECPFDPYGEGYTRKILRVIRSNKQNTTYYNVDVTVMGEA